MPSDGLLCQAKIGFMPSVPNYGQSEGYHMHNIVVSHGVGYVYVELFGVEFLIDEWRWIAMNINDDVCDDGLLCQVMGFYAKWWAQAMGFYAKRWAFMPSDDGI